MTDEPGDPSADGATGNGTGDRQSPEERARKFAEGAPGIPRKAVVFAVVAFVVLGLGGVVLDHFFGAPDSSASTVTTGTNPPPLETTVPPTTAPTRTTLPAIAGVASGAVALMDLTKLKSAQAPGFSLEAKDGSAVSLASLRGKVVVLSFFDSECNDICPVLAEELRQAASDLGDDATDVVMVTVNTDPLATALELATPAEDAAGLGASVSEWHFLTGTLPELDAVWKAYGVGIEAQSSTGIVSHNDVLYFIDAQGRLRLRATPFADESPSGAYSLPEATEKQFASGIAQSARSLIGQGSET